MCDSRNPQCENSPTGALGGGGQEDLAIVGREGDLAMEDLAIMAAMTHGGRKVRREAPAAREEAKKEIGSQQLVGKVYDIEKLFSSVMSKMKHKTRSSELKQELREIESAMNSKLSKMKWAVKGKAVLGSDGMEEGMKDFEAKNPAQMIPDEYKR